MRQAQARLLATGFKLAENEYIAGEKDWVYGVKYKGRTLTNGEKSSRRFHTYPNSRGWRSLSSRIRFYKYGNHRFCFFR